MIHSFEEDVDEIAVYRLVGYYFPQARSQSRTSSGMEYSLIGKLALPTLLVGLMGTGRWRHLGVYEYLSKAMFGHLELWKFFNK